MAFVIEKQLDPVEPAEQVPEYEYTDIDLGGESWNYRLFWNDRAERWQIDLENDDGRAIRGERLVPNYPIGWAHTGRRPSNGYLMLYDTADDDGRTQCTYEGLGNRWQLVWLEDDGTDAANVRPWSISLP